MKIEYVTSNSGKFEEAQLILEGWTLEQVTLDLPELQGDRQEIIKAKAREALRILKRPLIVEDVCLYCNALNGLPGPYIKDFLKKLTPEGFVELVHKYSDHTAQVICTAAFIKRGGEPICFEGILEGTLVSARGNTKHGQYSWNGIFLPKGATKTFAEHSMRELSQISMRRLALTQLKGYLETHEPQLRGS